MDSDELKHTNERLSEAVKELDQVKVNTDLLKQHIEKYIQLIKDLEEKGKELQERLYASKKKVDEIYIEIKTIETNIK